MGRRSVTWADLHCFLNKGETERFLSVSPLFLILIKVNSNESVSNFFHLIFFSLSVSAQQFKRIFLFNDFVQAQIKFRNHSVSVVSLNYDASNKTMLFRQGEEMMEMTNPAQVDTVIIGKRKFVPVGRGFYEVVCRKEGVVYIDWLLKDVNIGSKGALGSVTQGSVKNLQMSDLGLNGTEMYTPYERQKIGSTEVYRRKMIIRII